MEAGDQMLTFSFEGNDVRSDYWAGNPCGGVLKTADFVIGNLRQA